MNKRRLILWITVICLLAVLIPGTALAVTDGWNMNSDGTWSYYENGAYYEDGVFEIEGAYYGFNWNGDMYDDTSFGFYDNELDRSIYYRAKAGGKLYVNEWYESEWGEWYYYGSGGKAANDFVQIGGQWYFFDYEGRMIGTGLVQSADGRYYILYNEGKGCVELTTAGWYNVGGDYYYYKGNGELYREEVAQIEGKYYGFDWEGKMMKDQSFSIGYYDEAQGQWVYPYYRAKADGSLYVNEWYQEEDNYYYYGVGGVAPEDFYKVGNTWYFFGHGGYMITDQKVYSNLYGKYYYISQDGKSSVVVPENGWYQIDGEYHYTKDGSDYTYGVYSIDGKYYAFDGSGRMYDDTSFDFYDYDRGEWIYYRAKVGGVLYVNEWYQDGDDYYYYGAEGKAPRYEVLNIGGKYYGFRNDGCMRKNTDFDCNGNLYRAKVDGTLYVNEWYKNGYDRYYYGAAGVGAQDFVQIGGTWYFFDSAKMVKDRLVWSQKYESYYIISADGTSSTKISGSGWVSADGVYYYVQDDQILSGGIYKIGNAYYGFDWNGRMYDDQQFDMEIYTDEDGWIWYNYRAKAGGKLYVNEWYQSGTDWFYYGAEGKGCHDFTKIGNTWYFFRNARMITDELVYSELYGKYYAISKDGKSSREIAGNGWLEVGGHYYYILGGELVTGKVQKIGGNYYGFDYDGRMYESTSFNMYNEELDRWVYYRAKKGGALYINEWYQNGDSWYYYGVGGVAAEDFTKIGNTWYFFEHNGYMTEGTLVYSELYEGYYVIGKGGTTSSKVTTDGWVKAEDGYYYIKDGQLYESGVFQIGGKYYGFNNGGRMFEDCTFDFYDDETGNWIYYRAKANGELYVNCWYEDEWGDWYYYGEGGAAARGYTKLGGAYYFFGDSGYMYESSYAHIDGKCYAFGADGKQITKTGKQNIGGAYIYVNADGSIADEQWVKIGNNWYYFGPYMYANCLATIDGNLYAVDNSGICEKVTGNGVYDVGFDKVYLKNGEICNGWQKIGSDWFYFDPNMYSNGVYEIDEELYVFDKDGKMFTGGWLLLGDTQYKGYYEDNCNYVYADASGKALTGLQTIDGKRYYFGEWSGFMYTDTSVTVDGVTYVIDRSGVVISIDGDGWKLVDGRYYYVKDSELVREDSLTIGGKEYAFDYSGVMLTNTIYWLDEERMVLAGPDGVLKSNGWYKMDGDWYYVDANGCVLTGRQTIGGKTYILEYSAMIGTFVYDGMIVTTDSTGAIVSEKDPADGWTYVDGRVLYYKNGEPYNGWVGDYLILNGRMQVNCVAEWEGEYYALDIYGKYVKSGWHRFSYADDYSEYVYVKSGGKLCSNEWLQLGSSWYYFDYVWMLSDGTYWINDEQCKFAANGVYLGKVSASNGDGWKQVGSNWYYIHAGEPVTGVNWIDGKRYVFDWNGVMASGGFHEMDNIWFYAEANGVVPNYTGWKQIKGQWCYFGADNLPAIGWFQDKGKTYYAEVMVEDDELCIGLRTGYMYYNGRLHYFNSDGVHQGVKTPADGWFKADGDWYYIKNGYPVNGMQTIGGKEYVFSNGIMLDDCIHGAIYYGSDGVRVTKTGWYKVGDEWIYVMDDGYLASGVQKIGGKEYYFSNYIMVR